MRERAFLFVLLFALPLFAQTATVVVGVAGDSSIVAPVVSWNRTNANADALALSLNGWTIAAEGTRRRGARNHGVISLAITPIHANAGDHVYGDGETFDASTIEATFGRIDTLAERWLSDVRIVALHARIDDVAGTYAGIRTRQAWRRITAEDPLLQTFEGNEIAGVAEVYAGDRTWSRIKLDQRFSRKWGRLRAGESISAFHGHALDRASEFLPSMYGYRYGELRLDRGASIIGDVSYTIAPSIALGAHAGVLRSRDLDARGIALDVTASWRGIGMRIGVGRSDDQTVVYGSALIARFLR